jgi:hypothetical protein
MARAIIARGAEYFNSWDEEVTARHTDAATQSLLERIQVDRAEPPLAVADTLAQFGRDPEFGAALLVQSR